MDYSIMEHSQLSVKIRLAEFKYGGTGEYHAIIESVNLFIDTKQQYFNLERAVSYLLDNKLPPETVLAFKYYFVSDVVNHYSFLHNDENCAAACSVVQQQPLSGHKAILWAYFVEKAQVEKLGGNSVVMQRGKYRHFFDMQMYGNGNDAGKQTSDMFENYSAILKQRNCNLLNNAVRTWIYVYDVDNRYAGMVAARKEHFAAHRLNEQTHYIASTGIEGHSAKSDAVVMMNAYSVAGLDDGQIGFLKSKTNLNDTIEYGVTFERASRIDYGDRRHIFVSGTASINHLGEVVAPFDIEKQTDRTLNNISALLTRGGADFNDVAQMIVYLRDSADYNFVYAKLKERFPFIPFVIVCAAVCRPQWLIEIECMAIVNIKNKNYDAF